MQEEVERLLTVREVAERQHVSMDFVKDALRSGALRGHKVGTRGDWRIPLSAYEEWVRAGASTRRSS